MDVPVRKPFKLRLFRTMLLSRDIRISSRLGQAVCAGAIFMFSQGSRMRYAMNSALRPEQDPRCWPS